MLSEERLRFWQQVDGTEMVSEPLCWQGCGSFCCRWEHPAMHLRFIPRGGTLFYTGEEFEYFAGRNRLIQGETAQIAIPCGKGRELRIRYAPCPAPERCRQDFDRTLYCKLYPFLPLVENDGTVSALGHISPYDMTLEVLERWDREGRLNDRQRELTGIHRICTVKKCADKYLDQWQNSRILQDPYVLLHLRAGRHVRKRFLEELEKHRDELLATDFWLCWELLYLRGRFFDPADLSARITEDYEIIAQRCGDFPV